MRRGVLAVAAALLCTCVPAAIAAPAGAQASGPPEIRLLDSGRAPREPLRFGAAAGTSSTSRLTTEVTITQELGGRSQTVSTPPITITLSNRVASVTPEGEATIDFSYDKAEVKDDGSVSEDQLAQIRQRLEPIAGITGSLTISTTGAASKGSVDIPSDVDEQTRQLLEQLEEQATQLTIPFPEEAVGKGARWKATQELEVSGATLRQTTRYELKSRDGDRAKVSAHIDQRADNETLDTPQGSATLVRSRADGKGTITADLRQPLPASAKLQINARQRIRAQGQTLDQTVKTKVRLQPVG